MCVSIHTHTHTHTHTHIYIYIYIYIYTHRQSGGLRKIEIIEEIQCLSKIYIIAYFITSLFIFQMNSNLCSICGNNSEIGI